MKWKRKPVHVNAWRCSGTVEDLPDFIKHAVDMGQIQFDQEIAIVAAVTGVTKVPPGNWIVALTDTMLAAYTDELFREMYEPAVTLTGTDAELFDDSFKQADGPGTV